MRFVLGLAALLAASACRVAPSGDGESARTSSTALSSSGDSSDSSCQVVLRHTYIDFESSLGPQTDCASGTCWVVVTVTFDVAMSQSLAESAAYVLYQGEGSATWEQSAQAEPVFGCDEPPDGPCAPVGFRRYQVVLNGDTFMNGPGAPTVNLIPFIAPYAGGRLFDHNRVASPLGSYVLDAQNNWTIPDDDAACPGAPPTGRLTATFATGWQNASTGSLVPGGKQDVAYDVYRMPQTLGCTTDGVDAFATVGYVLFQPSGQVLSELASGPLDSTTNQFASLPLEFDVPGGTTSAALWFHGSSDCGGEEWDSNFGQNYVFAAP